MATVFLTMRVASAQTPLSDWKPTEKIIIQYETLVANGDFLPPEGWKVAGKLYEQADVFPPDGEISLSEYRSNGRRLAARDRADIVTKWTDFFWRHRFYVAI